MSEKEELYDAFAKSVINNMDKQIVPMVWNALKAGRHDEVTKVMSRRQEILDQMTARSKEGLNESKSKRQSNSPGYKRRKRRTRKRG